MKKVKNVITSCILSLCLLFSYSTLAMAAESTPCDSLNEVSDASVRAVTVLQTFDYPFLDGFGTVYNVSPGSGQDLNMRLDLTSGGVRVYLMKPNGSYTTIASYTDAGRHYLDLDNLTQNGTYKIRIWGTAATFSGRIYIGNA